MYWFWYFGIHNHFWMPWSASLLLYLRSVWLWLRRRTAPQNDISPCSIQIQKIANWTKENRSHKILRFGEPFFSLFPTTSRQEIRMFDWLSLNSAAIYRQHTRRWLADEECSSLIGWWKYFAILGSSTNFVIVVIICYNVVNGIRNKNNCFVQKECLWAHAKLPIDNP